MPLASNYNPKEFEERIYKIWQENGVGSPEEQSKQQGLTDNSDTYTILMPPPNLTGDLHAGHAFGHYLMDTLTRIYRQKGKKGLWFPGVDHAGIQMEGVVNKILKEEGIDRDHLSEKEFLDFTWQKAMEWRDNQRKQSSVLGDTPDYERNLFTLDPRAVKMVNYAFVKYWYDNLIYKGSYLVNWSVGLQTALSDVSGEIEYKKRKDLLVSFEYRIEGLKINNEELKIKLQNHFIKNPIIVSTVRPETVFGDTAIAIHSEVLKKSLSNGGFSSGEIGRVLEILESGGLKITFKIESLGVENVKLVVSDKVDADFGTGALKITPGHDPFDFELYNEFVSKGLLDSGFPVAVDRDGKLTEVCGEFAGETVESGRVNVIKKMIEGGVVPKRKEGVAAGVKLGQLPKELQDIPDILDYEIEWNYEHNVTICERSKTVIEPLISEEFFLSYHKKFEHTYFSSDKSLRRNENQEEGQQRETNLQELGLEGVKKTRFFSEDFRQMATNFLENIHDWCVSRDLTWGHKIPVWYCEKCNSAHRFGGPTDNIPGLVVAEEKPAVCPDCGGKELTQEKKIFDTWFSSCLWPLSTLGYYESQKKIKHLIFDWYGVVYRLNGEEIESTKQVIEEQKEKGVGCYYLTNADETLFKDRTNTEVFGYFDGGIASYESEYEKPDPEFYQELIKKYGLEPSQAIYIDDSPANVAAARELGMNAIWYDGKIDLQAAINEVENEHLETDFENYYPTQAMTTAKEIFYLWIVRMIVLGMYFAGDVPFEGVVITPTVLDGYGKKMSKSLKNGLEPVEAIDKFSSDSLRLGMLGGCIPNRNMKFGGDMADTIMERYRNFGNKIWNVARFFEYQSKESGLDLKDTPINGELSPVSVWILDKFVELEKELEKNLDNYELAHSVDALTKFLWDYFADWYVEYLKTDLSQLPFAYELFKQYIVTISPYMPFETEVIWLNFFEEDSLLAFELKNAEWGESTLKQAGAEKAKEFEVVSDFVANIRSLRGLFAIDPSLFIKVYTKSELLLRYADFVKLVGRAELVNEEKSGLYSVQESTYSYSLDIISLIKDVDKEKQRTEKEIQSLEKQVMGLEKQLGNENFVNNAEPEIVAEKKQNLEDRKIDLEQQKSKLEFLSGKVF